MWHLLDLLGWQLMSREKPRLRLWSWGFSLEISLIAWFLFRQRVRGGTGARQCFARRFRPHGAHSVVPWYAAHTERPERTVCLDTFANLFRVERTIEAFSPDRIQP